jgi:hypothetical protein
MLCGLFYVPHAAMHTVLLVRSLPMLDMNGHIKLSVCPQSAPIQNGFFVYRNIAIITLKKCHQSFYLMQKLANTNVMSMIEKENNRMMRHHQ